MKRKHGRASARETSTPRTCDIPGCGRPRAARGLCQSHDRQARMTGEPGQIRPYRPRSQGTVKYAGLRLSASCAERIDEFAAERQCSKGAAISQILEEWYAELSGHSDSRRRRGPARRR